MPGMYSDILTTSHAHEYNLKWLAEGDMQILSQLPSVECLLRAVCWQAFTFHILASCKVAYEKRHKWTWPHPITFPVLAPWLVLLGTWPPLRKGAMSSIVLYLPVHSTWCRILCPEDIWKNLRCPLLVVTYRISSGPSLPSLLLPCLPLHDQITQIYS